MSNAITIRTDSTAKKAISDFAASLGMSTSAFATVVLLQAVRERRIVLTPDLEPLEPTPYLENIMREADADRKAGRNVSKFDTTEDAIAHLRSL